MKKDARGSKIIIELPITVGRYHYFREPYGLRHSVNISLGKDRKFHWGKISKPTKEQ